MVYKRFRVNVLLQIVFITITLTGILYLFLFTSNYISIGILFLLLASEIYLLFKYIDKINQDLVRLFEAIDYADFTLSFPNNKKEKSFKELYHAFNHVVKKFKEIKSEKEEYMRLLQNIMEHLPIGVIVYEEEGSVLLANKTVKKLLQLQDISNVKILESLNASFTKSLLALENNRKDLLNIPTTNVQIAVNVTTFILKERKLKIASLQNIRQELEQKELESWENLIRILTHEIMNSITPISSLASTANEMIKQRNVQENDDLQTAVQTIENRSKKLLHFVDSYRKVTRLPQPKLQSVSIRELFKEIKILMQSDGSSFIEYHIEPPEMELKADKEMIEQALINLIQNAKEAIKDSSEPVIMIRVFRDNQYRINIQVQDNGNGIDPDLIDKIFIPFFSTKKQGSGIGLSLCRQIMLAHNGTIDVKTESGQGTTFVLKF